MAATPHQLDLFRELTPAGMWCSNDPALYGQRHLPRAVALRRAYIDPNPRGQVWAMVFDIDRKSAATAWADAPIALPCPNWIAQNPSNEHAHLGYILAAPVSRSEASRGKPLRFLARIQSAMTLALDADRAYTHRLTKTPGHPRWRTFWERGRPYELSELRDYLGEALPLRIARAEAVGEGRNVTLFDTLRSWAYRARLAFTNQDAWFGACRAQARALNEFESPLPVREVDQVAKSVAKWTWQHITRGGFSEVQTVRGQRGGLASGIARTAEATSRNLAILETIG